MSLATIHNISNVNKLRILLFIFFLIFYIALNEPHVTNDAHHYYILTEDGALNQSLMYRLDLPSENDVENRKRILEFMGGASKLQGKQFDINNPEPINASLVPILLSIIGIPFYYLSSIFPIAPYKFVVLLVNPIITSLTSVVIFSLYFKLSNSIKTSFVLALFFGLTSFVVPWTSEYYTRLLVALVLISSIYFIYLARIREKNIFSFFGGILTASIFLSQTADFQLIPPILAYGIIIFRKNRKLLISFLMGFLLIVIIQMSINEMRFDSPTSFGDDTAFRASGAIHVEPRFEGYLGLLLSPGAGLWFFYPITILFPLGFYLLYKNNKSLSLLFISLFIITLVSKGEEVNWHAFGSWGPRYLLPILPALTISLGPVIEKFSKKIAFKIFVIIFSFAGFFVNLLGSLVWYKAGYEFFWPPYNRGEVEFSDLFWSLNWSPIVSHFQVVTSDYILERTKGIEHDYGSFFHQMDPTCGVNLMFYCEHGILPIILFSLILVFVSFLMLKILFKEKTPIK